MQKIIIHRTYEDNYQTLGELTLYSPQRRLFTCKTLELPWNDNKINISRIPTGLYKAVKHDSPKFGDSIWLKNVPNRSEILIHIANFKYDLLGCIAIGDSFVDIDFDEHRDVANSTATMKKLISKIDNKLEVIILDIFD